VFGLDYTKVADNDGNLAIHVGDDGGHTTAVRALVDAGADVNAVDDTRALHHAAQHGHELTVRALVELGADVEAADTDGWQALHHAAENGHESTVRALVELGADVNAAGNTTGERCILPLGMATTQRSEHSSNLAPMSMSPTPTAIGRYTLPLIMVTRQRCERPWQ
jgi:ankyrin repeat protein